MSLYETKKAAAVESFLFFFIIKFNAKTSKVAKTMVY